MFYENPDCNHATFADRFDFISDLEKCGGSITLEKTAIILS